MSDDGSFVAVPFDGLSNVYASEIFVPVRMVEPLGVGRIAEIDASQFSHIYLTPHLIGIGNETDEDVNAELIQKLFARSIFGRQLFDELPLVKPTIQRRPIHRLSLQGSQDPFLAVHASPSFSCSTSSQSAISRVSTYLLWKDSR